MTTLAVDVITNEGALAALRPEWDALWRETPCATPFQSTAWLLSWWRQFGTGRPRVAVLRGDGRLVGLLPLYILDEGSERKLLPLGAGITDYFDALLEPDCRRAPRMRCFAPRSPRRPRTASRPAT